MEKEKNDAGRRKTTTRTKAEELMQMADLYKIGGYLPISMISYDDAARCYSLALQKTRNKRIVARAAMNLYDIYSRKLVDAENADDLALIYLEIAAKTGDWTAGSILGKKIYRKEVPEKSRLETVTYLINGMNTSFGCYDILLKIGLEEGLDPAVKKMIADTIDNEIPF